MPYITLANTTQRTTEILYASCAFIESHSALRQLFSSVFLRNTLYRRGECGPPHTGPRGRRTSPPHLSLGHTVTRFFPVATSSPPGYHLWFSPQPHRPVIRSHRYARLHHRSSATLRQARCEAREKPCGNVSTGIGSSALLS